MGGKHGERVLWMGAVQSNWTEDYLREIFKDFCGEKVSVKLFKEKMGSLKVGYAFIEFSSHDSAKQALESLQGRPIPNTGVVFRLNWATHKAESEEPQTRHFSLFVGDLSPLVSEQVLLQTFQKFYPSCCSASVVVDPKTGKSKSYGFVRFLNQYEQQHALQTMQGFVLMERSMRLGPATSKSADGEYNHLHLSQGFGLPLETENDTRFLQHFSSSGGPSYITASSASATVAELENSTLFVGRLDNNITAEELKQFFEDQGFSVLNATIPKHKKGCGFVKFSTAKEASFALKKLNNRKLGESKIRLDWGRVLNSDIKGRRDNSYHTATSDFSIQPNIMNLQNYQTYQTAELQNLQMQSLQAGLQNLQIQQQQQQQTLQPAGSYYGYYNTYPPGQAFPLQQFPQQIPSQLSPQYGNYANLQPAYYGRGFYQQ